MGVRLPIRSDFLGKGNACVTAARRAGMFAAANTGQKIFHMGSLRPHVARNPEEIGIPISFAFFHDRRVIDVAHLAEKRLPALVDEEIIGHALSAQRSGYLMGVADA